MNQTFSVALNQPSAQRDFEVSDGDDFTVAVTAFATDDPEDVNPVDLTGSTLTLYVGCYQWARDAIVGTGTDPVTFTFTDVFDRRHHFGWRTPFRIVLTSAGRSYTVAHGEITLRSFDRCGGPSWGFCDYGWWWGV